MTRSLEERARRRIEDECMRECECEVRERSEQDARLTETSCGDGEHRSLRRKRVRQRRPGQRVGDADRGGRERDRAEQRSELALPALPHGDRRGGEAGGGDKE